MVKEHTKRCLTSLIIKEIHTKTIMSYYLTPEWPSSKSPLVINAGEGVEKRESSCTIGGNVNCCSHYEKQYGGSLIKLKNSYHMIQQSHAMLCLVAQSCPTLCNPWTIQRTRLLCPWGFSRQEYWSGLPCPPPKDLPNSGIEPESSALQEDSLPAELPGKLPSNPTPGHTSRKDKSSKSKDAGTLMFTAIFSRDMEAKQMFTDS